MPWALLTSFVGRAREAAELARLLQDHRLVTVTGPGGVGKTRLAAEVARAAAGEFPDGVHFAGLGTVSDPVRVPVAVAAALGVRQARGRSAQEMVTGLLASRRLLLVIDNCEHVLDAVAELCGELLKAADDVRVLATSREPLWVGGEARYRLSPLELPGSDDPAEIGRSAAVTLFADRARQADLRFALGDGDAPLAARVVARLDGMPLAIELAAARVEALGLAGLADRVDDALRLLEGRDSLAAARHRSLAAVADWSYRLLSPPEQQVFRRLAVFPGPFTLEAAEAVAGPDAGPVVQRLVDCSLVVPPRAGPDGRMRYPVLQTLRAYGLARLAEAGQERETEAVLAGFALSVASQAAAGLETSDPGRELAALRWLDAEDALVAQALNWALANDPGAALALATALAPWWLQRGRVTEGYAQLAAAAERATPGCQAWAAAQVWLGYLSSYSGDHASSLAHHASACEAAGSPPPCLAVHAMVGRAIARVNLGQVAEAAEDTRQALTLARRSGYRAGEVHALTSLGLIAYYSRDYQEALSWIEQAQECLAADVPGFITRLHRAVLTVVLSEVGDLDAARSSFAAGLARSREAGDLLDLASLLLVGTNLEGLAGNVAQMRAYLHEAVDIAARTGDRNNLRNSIDEGGFLCAATGHCAEAVTLWAAFTADVTRTGIPGNHTSEYGRRRECMRRIEAVLQPGQVREAADRGSRMTLAAAAELVAMLTAPQESGPEHADGLTVRERELVTLVAQGATNAEIAAQLFISVRTVSSHLDRIRDKTGYRRRADLTRLALREGLV